MLKCLFIRSLNYLIFTKSQFQMIWPYITRFPLEPAYPILAQCFSVVFHKETSHLIRSVYMIMQHWAEMS